MYGNLALACPAGMTEAAMAESPGHPDHVSDDHSVEDDLLALLAPGGPTGSTPTRPRAVPRPLRATMSARPVGTGNAPPLRTGARFQPLPATMPTASAASPGPLRLAARPGTPVHAVEAGTVELPRRPGDPLRLRGADLVFEYGGIAATSVTVGDGDAVEAGAILGSTVDDLVFGIAGGPVDVAAYLVGLPDPNELGHAAVGTGADVDPDTLDREIAGSAAEVPREWGNQP
jgi:hypothetical protein